jgi:hypothetical protein
VPRAPAGTRSRPACARMVAWRELGADAAAAAAAAAGAAEAAAFLLRLAAGAAAAAAEAAGAAAAAAGVASAAGDAARLRLARADMMEGREMRGGQGGKRAATATEKSKRRGVSRGAAERVWR